ncbi:unannotated protein [freshwater metagenome]
MNFLNEVSKHAFGRVEVGDDTVLERADSDDIARGATDHALGFRANRQDAAGVVVDGDDRWLI